MGAPPRAARIALLVVLACLTSVLTSLPAPSAGADTRTGDGAGTTAGSTAGTTAPERVQQRSSQRTGNFPWLPDRCYDSRGVTKVPCRLTRFPGRPSLVLWGDSHAQMYLPPLRRAAEQRRFNLVVVVYGGCPVSLPYPDGSPYPRTGCDGHNTRAYEFVRTYVARHPRTRILVGGFWAGYRRAWALMEREQRTGQPSGLLPYHEQMARLAVKRSQPMMRRIGRLGAPVDLIGQAASVPFTAPSCPGGFEPYQCDLPRSTALAGEAGNRAWLRQQLASRLPGRPRIIDTSPRYCSRTTCFAHVEGVDTYYDDIHLSKRLAAKMGRFFRPVVRDLLAR